MTICLFGESMTLYVNSAQAVKHYHSVPISPLNSIDTMNNIDTKDTIDTKDSIDTMKYI